MRTLLSGILAAGVCLWGAAAFSQEPLSAPAGDASPAPQDTSSPDDSVAPKKAENWPFVPATQQPSPSGMPWQLLEKARQSYEYGDFRGVIAFVRAALSQEMEESLVQDAYMLLGLCSYLLHEYSEAKDAFTSLLLRVPDYRLDPVLVPPNIITFFEELKVALKDRLDPIRARLETQPARDKPKTPKARVVEVRYERHQWAYNFLPFGVGQFQNGHTAKAYGLLGSQAAMLALNLASYLSIITLSDADGYYTKSKADTARGLQVTQYVSAGAFLGLWLYGVIDGLVYYQDEVKVGAPQEVSPTLAAPGPRASFNFTGDGFAVHY